MSTTSRVELEQIVDWRAAFIAGLVAGFVFLLVQMLGQAMIVGQSAWLFPQYVGAIVLGEEVLSAGFDLGAVVAGIVLHLVFSVIFALILAAIIHEWNMVVGLVVGTLFGLALYAINYYTFTRFFPWFFPVTNWLDIVAHALFGLTAGGVYEALEIERFVRVERTEVIEE
jgi:hypothetical protein